MKRVVDKFKYCGERKNFRCAGWGLSQKIRLIKFLYLTTIFPKSIFRYQIYFMNAQILQVIKVVIESNQGVAKSYYKHQLSKHNIHYWM